MAQGEEDAQQARPQVAHVPKTARSVWIIICHSPAFLSGLASV